MTSGDKKGFLRGRAVAFLDNAIFYAFVVFGLGAIGAAAVYGSNGVTLPLWAIVAFGAVQIGCVIAITVVFRRRPTAPSEDDPARVLQKVRHSHRALLRRIHQLESSAADANPMDVIPWPVAQEFNRILTDAQAATGDPGLFEMADLERSAGGYAAGAQYTTIQTLLGQIRITVEDAE